MIVVALGAPRPDDLNGWLEALRNGAEPWLPTADEAETANAEQVKAWRAEQEFDKLHYPRLTLS